MSAEIKIEWTDHPLNSWWGYHRFSPACDNCYAAAVAKHCG
jgi:protein gp37